MLSTMLKDYLEIDCLLVAEIVNVVEGLFKNLLLPCSISLNCCSNKFLLSTDFKQVCVNVVRAFVTLGERKSHLLNVY